MSPTERDPLLPKVGIISTKLSSSPTANNDVSRATLIRILAVVWMVSLLGAMNVTTAATLQQPIGDDFKQSHKASYVGTSYLLSACCFTPLYGRLSDIFGRKGAMLLALVLFTTGTFLCAIATSMEVLIGARVIAGMGGGGILTVSSVVVSDLVPLRSRGLFQGFAVILFGAGAGLGGLLGGWIHVNFGWRTAFGFQVPLLILAAIFVSIHLNITLPQVSLTIEQKLAKIDWLGSLTLVLAVSSLVVGFGLKATEDLQWSDPFVWMPLIFSGVSFASFWFVEAKVSPEPVLPMRLLLSRTPLCVALTNLFGSIVGFSIIYNVPLYFMAVRPQSASRAGLHLLPISLALPVGALFSGWMMRRTGRYSWVVTASTTISLFASISVAMWKEDTTSELKFWLTIAPNGLGFAAVQTSTFIAITACVPREDMATAIGVVYLSRAIGQVLGVSLSGTLFQTILTKQLRARMPGPDASIIVDAVRRNAGLVGSLGSAQRQAAVDSFAFALRTIFICQAAVSFITILCALPIEERPLSDSCEEHEGYEDRLKETA
ncbi:Multidrug resistance protein fnx1 [Serendipita indica DSM 11827]|uniref:Related to VBA1-Vacuolar Basic Amino acid transporter n=1 Tax=Serendipita indica (strain DSM 11827) TaxID=1109443 RepID=G4TDV1_SERID|nr:Multidrug resistance protein fnx1 [Serendipita indica DSM 11827]CCA69509.1 related to VBA1-Vacuolar Basic Amino acid transporter [Serendipita indica DSM 11827]